ncbi:MAG: monoheme cytochrome C [Crocinitomix sp.]|nr:monoheme cytochrome C [Crocinitomix sp.]
MTEKKEIYQQAIKQAKRTISWATLLIVVAVIFTIQLTYFPRFFSAPNENISALDTSAIDPMLATMNLNPDEIENGIHIPTGLIVDDGVDQVIMTCGACHSLDLVTQNKADRKGWKDIIVWMQETQGLWDLGEKEEVILTYLAKNYAPVDEGRRRNIEIIDWYEL